MKLLELVGKESTRPRFLIFNSGFPNRTFSSTEGQGQTHIVLINLKNYSFFNFLPYFTHNGNTQISAISRVGTVCITKYPFNVLESATLLHLFLILPLHHFITDEWRGRTARWWIF